MFFLLISSSISSFESKSVNPFILFLKILGVTFFIILINVLPNFLYWINNGLNNSIAVRHLIETDIYGLRLSQLLLPIWGHNNDFLAEFSRSYHDALRPVTEATSSALGIVASIGFVILIFSLFIRIENSSRWSIFILSKLVCCNV